MKTKYKNMAFLKILMKQPDPAARFMDLAERASKVLFWIGIIGAIFFIIIPALHMILTK
jgi:hypothetical protein